MRARRSTTVIARRVTGRPKLQLQFDDIQHTTLVRYDKMMAQLNTLMFLLGGVTLDALLHESATAALQVWTMLLMQIHYDCVQLAYLM